MAECKTCSEEICEDEMATEKDCRWCVRKKAFASFASECGLERYPCPTGERYVYRLDGSCDGKKGECVDFMDDLWDALAKSKGREDLMAGEE